MARRPQAWRQGHGPGPHNGRMGNSSLVAWLVAAALGYALVCGVIWLVQDRLLFLPDVPGRALAATPASQGLHHDDVAVTTADGVRLHGWWVPVQGARLTIAHFHGNAGNIGDRLELLGLLHALGANVLLFDYRGYGRSDGAPGEAGLYQDAEAVWAYLTGTLGLPPAAIVLHGQSMGAAPAAWLAARRAPRALVVESAFTSVPDMAAKVYPWLPGRYLSRLQLDTRAAIARAPCPVLVIHSRGDEIVPYAMGEALFAAAPQPKTLLTLDGTHNDGFWVSRDAYLRGWHDFLARL